MLSHWLLVLVARFKVYLRAVNVRNRMKVWQDVRNLGHANTLEGYLDWEVAEYGNTMKLLDHDEFVLGQLAESIRERGSASTFLMSPDSDMAGWTLCLESGAAKVGIAWAMKHGFGVAGVSPGSARTFKSLYPAIRYAETLLGSHL